MDSRVLVVPVVLNTTCTILYRGTMVVPGTHVLQYVPWYTCTIVLVPGTCSHTKKVFNSSRYTCMVPLVPMVPMGTRVPWYQMVHSTYTSTYTCTYVHVYVLIMLCHNFLIGKGHTCALRTTCVRTYVRTYVLHVYLEVRTNK